MELTQILQKALEIGGSDIFLIPGSPATAKVKGHLKQLTTEKLLPDDTARMIEQAYEMAGEHTDELLHRDGPDLDVGAGQGPVDERHLAGRGVGAEAEQARAQVAEVAAAPAELLGPGRVLAHEAEGAGDQRPLGPRRPPGADRGRHAADGVEVGGADQDQPGDPAAQLLGELLGELEGGDPAHGVGDHHHPLLAGPVEHRLEVAGQRLEETWLHG